MRKKKHRIRRKVTLTNWRNYYFDDIVKIGIAIYFISLFLPWAAVSFGGLNFSLGVSWISLFNDEIKKIHGDILEYIVNANNVVLFTLLLPIIGFVLLVFGWMVRNSFVVFTAALFLFTSPLSFIYFLSTSIPWLNGVSISGIGVWGALIGALHDV